MSRALLVGTIGVTAALVLATSLVALAQSTTPTIATGHEVFERWCAPCHAAGAFHAGTAGLQVKYRGSTETPVLEKRTDLTPTFVTVTVRHGVNAMPQFRKTEITDAQLQAVADYLSRNNPRLPSRN